MKFNIIKGVGQNYITLLFSIMQVYILHLDIRDTFLTIYKSTLAIEIAFSVLHVILWIQYPELHNLIYSPELPV